MNSLFFSRKYVIMRHEKDFYEKINHYILMFEVNHITRNGENLLRNSMHVIQFMLRQKSNIGMVQHQKAILYILQKVSQIKMLQTSGLKQWMKKNI